MAKHHHRLLWIVLGAVVVVGGIAYWLYATAPPPPVVVTAWDSATGVGTFQCGSASGQFNGNNGFNCGGGFTLNFTTLAGSWQASLTKGGQVVKQVGSQGTGTF